MIKLDVNHETNLYMGFELIKSLHILIYIYTCNIIIQLSVGF